MELYFKPMKKQSGKELKSLLNVVKFMNMAVFTKFQSMAIKRILKIK